VSTRTVLKALAPVMLAGAVIALPACAPVERAAEPAQTENLSGSWLAAQALAGDWDTEAQYAAAAPELKVTPQAGSRAPWLDRQHGRFIPVNAPALEAAWPGSHAVYLIWRRGGPDGPVSRQRLWQFGPDGAGSAQMRFYTLPAAPPQGYGPEALAALTPADLSGYPASCHLPVQTTPKTGEAGGWQAAIPDTCWITAASGRRMRLEAVIELDGQRLSYREAGTLESGAPAFVVPGTGAYAFERVAR
jgi:hypothetical protein